MFQRAGDIPYQPSYWLAALGAGGLSISFFMYLMWLVPHAGSPMPTWEHLLGRIDDPRGVPRAVRRGRRCLHR